MLGLVSPDFLGNPTSWVSFLTAPSTLSGTSGGLSGSIFDNPDSFMMTPSTEGVSYIPGYNGGGGGSVGDKDAGSIIGSTGSGAATGAALGGPWGAAIGAGVGLLEGLFGGKGKGASPTSGKGSPLSGLGFGSLSSSTPSNTIQTQSVNQATSVNVSNNISLPSSGTDPYTSLVTMMALRDNAAKGGAIVPALLSSGPDMTTLLLIGGVAIVAIFLLKD